VKIILIAAVGSRNELGKDNKLLWHLPHDLKRFKALTTGHCIIMGRKTYDSIGKPLPNRTSIVISRTSHKNEPGLVYVHSLNEALVTARKAGETSAYIIGGAQIFRESLPLADRLEMTFLKKEFDADVFFPETDYHEYDIIFKEDIKGDELSPYSFSYITYERKEKKAKAVFLDRDGVLNRETDDYITSANDLVINYDIVPFLKERQEEEYKLIVITNQGAIEKKRLTHEALGEIHEKLKNEYRAEGIEFDEIYYCPHHSDLSKCLCRKPEPLMIEKAMARFNINPNESFMIGDKERDIVCAEKAGVLGVLIESNEVGEIQL
jgi:dihydrofolate reductase